MSMYTNGVPKRIRYATRLDKYNARHARARSRGKRWANGWDHKPTPPSQLNLVEEGLGRA